jgi:hypothetical protein
MLKVCPENKILNPKTNRCVLKTGKIGKELLKHVEKTIVIEKQKSKTTSTHSTHPHPLPQKISVILVGKDHPLRRIDNKTKRFNVQPRDFLETDSIKWKGVKKDIKGTSLYKFFTLHVPECTDKNGQSYFPLFHGTSFSATKKILSEGLKPKGGTSTSGFMGFHLAREPAQSFHYMKTKQTQTDLPVLLQFHIDPEDTKTVKCSKDVVCRANDFCFRNEKAVSILKLNTIYLVQENRYNHSLVSLEKAKKELEQLLL